MRKAAPLALSLFFLIAPGPVRLDLAASLLGPARAQAQPGAEPTQAGAPVAPPSAKTSAPTPSATPAATPAQTPAPTPSATPAPAETYAQPVVPTDEAAPDEGAAVASPAQSAAAPVPVAEPTTAAYPPQAFPAGPLLPNAEPRVGATELPSPEVLFMQLSHVSAKLEYLKAERAQHRIGGPVAMMAAGFGTALVSGLVAFSILESAVRIDDIGTSTRPRDVRRYDFTDNGVVNSRDEDQARAAARAFGVVSGLGLGVGILGSVFFARRSALRNQHKAEIAGLKQQKRDLIRALRYQAGPGQFQLRLSGSF